ncbi:MAG: hypothetical protein KC931_10380 [Candidatus Omnitrophica bacterium]|nr:hypothetical protein [Candidatus Omnitrophota bacterium]MCA9417557.1 hypothetical protein [Candidatus Omnitrophota bacterium]MCA9425831.1 hypothetical protein [Candidatus Omnitrophota bacterium]MCA9432296.1 hypothetical protein [Candidatus Omnitrophota bacterium]MCA9447513.1 hypothetical protein [Candidatus Omnitrophota bacterium]
MKIQEIKNSYCCPKCHGKKPVLNEHVIPKGGKVPLPILNRFLFVSCGLCGYTEIYNLKIAEPVESEEEQVASEEVRRNQTSST